MPEQVVGRLDAIRDGDSAALTLSDPDGPVSLIAVRRGGEIFLYVNACPHLGWPLDFTPGRFLSPDRRHILCTGHGALFRIEDGQCVRGPCLGAALKPVAVRLVAGNIVAAAPPGDGGTLRGPQTAGE